MAHLQRVANAFGWIGKPCRAIRVLEWSMFQPANGEALSGELLAASGDAAMSGVQ